MEALDGNAIAGRLVEVFGVEMTTAMAVCASCGARGPIAESEVYVQAPGVVARCRTCRSILIVITTVRDINCVDARGLAELQAAE
jgi:hypothetical protein